MPLWAMEVVFQLPKSTIHRILLEQLEEIFINFQSLYISLDNWDQTAALDRWPGHIGIIDCIAVTINNWQKNCFSKKKGQQTLKYQVVINANTSQVLHIFGPHKGSRHDSILFHDSMVPLWLSNNQILLLGDKAYIGCDRITSPIKKTKGQSRLPPCDKKFNLKAKPYQN
jgi:hypothetical protein